MGTLNQGFIEIINLLYQVHDEEYFLQKKLHPSWM